MPGELYVAAKVLQHATRIGRRLKGRHDQSKQVAATEADTHRAVVQGHLDAGDPASAESYMATLAKEKRNKRRMWLGLGGVAVAGATAVTLVVAHDATSIANNAINHLPKLHVSETITQIDVNSSLRDVRQRHAAIIGDGAVSGSATLGHRYKALFLPIPTWAYGDEQHASTPKGTRAQLVSPVGASSLSGITVDGRPHFLLKVNESQLGVQLVYPNNDLAPTISSSQGVVNSQIDNARSMLGLSSGDDAGLRTAILAANTDAESACSDLMTSAKSVASDEASWWRTVFDIGAGGLSQHPKAESTLMTVARNSFYVEFTDTLPDGRTEFVSPPGFHYPLPSPISKGDHFDGTPVLQASGPSCAMSSGTLKQITDIQASPGVVLVTSPLDIPRVPAGIRG